jgi:hypothetical protein
MSSTNFYLMHGLRSDAVDNTQRNIYNTRFGDYNVSNYYIDPSVGSHVQFATQQPDVSWFAVPQGSSVGGAVIDMDSNLSLGALQGRSLEKLQLNQRQYLSIPYLGRGMCDPVLEAQIMQGESGKEKKSTSTIMSKSFMEYTQYPVDQRMADMATNPKFKIEESAVDGWIRGGILSREMMNDRDFLLKSRPSVNM